MLLHLVSTVAPEPEFLLVLGTLARLALLRLCLKTFALVGEHLEFGVFWDFEVAGVYSPLGATT